MAPHEAAKHRLGWLAPVAPFIRSVDLSETGATWTAHVAQVRSQESGNVCWPGGAAQPLRPHRMNGAPCPRPGWLSLRSSVPRRSLTPGISCEAPKLTGLRQLHRFGRQPRSRPPIGSPPERRFHLPAFSVADRCRECYPTPRQASSAEKQPVRWPRPSRTPFRAGRRGAARVSPSS